MYIECFAAGDPPRNLLGSSQRSPGPLAGFGAASRQGKEGMGKKTKERERREWGGQSRRRREGERREGQ